MNSHLAMWRALVCLVPRRVASGAEREEATVVQQTRVRGEGGALERLLRGLCLCVYLAIFWTVCVCVDGARVPMCALAAALGGLSRTQGACAARTERSAPRFPVWRLTSREAAVCACALEQHNFLLDRIE